MQLNMAKIIHLRFEKMADTQSDHPNKLISFTQELKYLEMELLQLDLLIKAEIQEQCP